MTDCPKDPSFTAMDEDGPVVDASGAEPLAAGGGAFLVTIIDNEGDTWRKLVSKGGMKAVEAALASLAAKGWDAEDSIESVLGELEDLAPQSVHDVSGVKAAVKFLQANGIRLIDEREYRPA